MLLLSEIIDQQSTIKMNIYNSFRSAKSTVLR